MNAFTEFHFSEYIGEFAQVREFRVFDVRGGARKALHVESGGRDPERCNAAQRCPDHDQVPVAWNTAGYEASDVPMTVVNSAGTESLDVRSMVAESPGRRRRRTGVHRSAVVSVNARERSQRRRRVAERTRIRSCDPSFSIGGLSAMNGGTRQADSHRSHSEQHGRIRFHRRGWQRGRLCGNSFPGLPSKIRRS